MRLCIAVCTYARPEQLRRTLELLKQQEAQGVRIDLVVIDNDPAGSAQDGARATGATYLTEARRGVGNARNRALDHIRSNPEYDAVVFFDDDQTPGPRWLDSFAVAHEVSPDAILSGPVQPRLDFDLPDWAKGGWPWSRPTLADGAELRTTGAGNVFLPRSVVSLPDCRFSPAFLQGMGEDTELFDRLTRRGQRILHVRDASALEDVPPERRTLEWLTTRARSSAEAWARMQSMRSRFGRGRIALSAAKRLVAFIPAPRGPVGLARAAVSRAEVRAFRPFLGVRRATTVRNDR